MKRKNRSTMAQRPLAIINNDSEKYNGKKKGEKVRTFIGIPTELHILINNLQTDKVFDVERTIRKEDRTEDDWDTKKTIKTGLTGHEARYLLTIIGMSDGFRIPYKTMCSLTGMHDSDVTKAKNDLLKKGLLILDREKNTLTPNYRYMYELFDTLYAENCMGLLNQNVVNHSIPSYESPQLDIEEHNIDTMEITTSNDNESLHIQEKQENTRKNNRQTKDADASSGCPIISVYWN